MQYATRENSNGDRWQYSIPVVHKVIKNRKAVISTMQHSQLLLEEVQGILQVFLQGLSGQLLKIQENELSFTNTETLFLPKSLHYFSKNRDHFLLYKAITAHLWAQIQFGTWQYDLATITIRYSHRDKAIRLFHVLERLRLDACIARELPGLYREMGYLLTQCDQPRIPAGWETIAQRLAKTTATVTESYQLLESVYSWPVPDPVCYQGMLFPEQVILNKSLPSSVQNKPSENEAIQNAIENHEETTTQLATDKTTSDETALFSSTITPSEISADQEMALVMQDSQTVAQYDLATPRETATSSDNSTTWLYPEWDYRDQRYHKNWCTVREVPVALAETHFVIETLRRYAPMIKTLRRTFEQLRGGIQRLKQQSFGEEIDLEALVSAQAERLRGLEMSDRVFTQWRRLDRDIAVIFMVDMSGSTRGWIHQVIKESLVLLCEALEKLGDRYAIYGFSGKTRQSCEIYPIKRFQEGYNNVIYQRISGITPQAYTRMGAIIRYLTQRFGEIDNRIKLLITLSDGKPDDEDEHYRGTYGIEDTRQALLEAKQQGIHPFCITIDTEAKTYLPHLYGGANYVVIDKIHQLPLKISDIYRQLTT